MLSRSHRRALQTRSRREPRVTTRATRADKLSLSPVAIDQPFAATMAHEVAAKPGIEREHQALPEERYDLGDHPAQGVTMEHGKPLQERCARQAAIGGDSSTCIDLESTCIDLESTTCPIAVNFW